MSDLTVQLRRLQHAANMLNYHQFCAALGWERDDYSKRKFQEFQKLGAMHVLSDDTLERAIAAYEANPVLG